jgi:phospholipid-binding lipoprotein MlaA
MIKAPTLLLLALLPLLTQCTSTAQKLNAPATAPLSAVTKPSTAPAATPAADDFDDLDEYAVVEISDQSYNFVFRPISKGYEKVIPSRVRKGIFNVYENAKFPVRFVNSALQGDLKKAGLHIGKFVVDTVGGVGGLVKRSDEIPVFAALPEEDTGKTFAKWGMGHGPYLIIPFLGPTSLRDGVGLGADYALNPANYAIYYAPGEYDWALIPPSGNTLRVLPSQIATYDESVRDAIDPYIAVRTAYIQYRDEFVKK